MKVRDPSDAELKAALMSPGPTGKNESCHLCGRDFRAFDLYALGWRKRQLVRACAPCSAELSSTVAICQQRPARYRMSPYSGRA